MAAVCRFIAIRQVHICKSVVIGVVSTCTNISYGAVPLDRLILGWNEFTFMI